MSQVLQFYRLVEWSKVLSLQCEKFVCTRVPVNTHTRTHTHLQAHFHVHVACTLNKSSTSTVHVFKLKLWSAVAVGTCSIATTGQCYRGNVNTTNDQRCILLSIHKIINFLERERERVREKNESMKCNHINDN